MAEHYCRGVLDQETRGPQIETAFGELLRTGIVAHFRRHARDPIYNNDRLRSSRKPSNVSIFQHVCGSLVLALNEKRCHSVMERQHTIPIPHYLLSLLPPKNQTSNTVFDLSRIQHAFTVFYIAIHMFLRSQNPFILLHCLPFLLVIDSNVSEGELSLLFYTF